MARFTAISHPEAVWSPAPAVALSVGLHAAAAAGAIASPAGWQWLPGGVAVNHLLLAGFGLWPRSGLLGPNLVRLADATPRRGEMALTFDDGPDPRVTPAVLDLLDRRGAKGELLLHRRRAAGHPDLVREIVARGHGVENHSHTHANAFACYPPGALHRELLRRRRRSAGLPAALLPSSVPPMGLRSPLLDPVPSRLRLRHVTWTRRGYDTATATPHAVLRRLSAAASPPGMCCCCTTAIARTAARAPRRA